MSLIMINMASPLVLTMDNSSFCSIVKLSELASVKVKKKHKQIMSDMNET